MILYKYVAPARINILQEGLVAFTPPWMFNDPFEAKPVLAKNDSEEVALAEAGNPNWSKLTDVERQPILDRIQELDAIYMKWRLTIEHATTLVGVLSLSAVKDHPLVWAHYTAHHTGFAIGFDTAHPSWVALQHKLGPRDEPLEMTYSPDRPRPLKISGTAPAHVWYTKSEEWRYEQEWRVTRLLRTATVKRVVCGQEIRLFAFPQEAVSHVILGCRAENILEGEVLEAVTRPPYENVEVLRAELDPHAFRLNIVPR
jgi:hypothetical protein